MAHYAFLDKNYLVTDVIVGKDESNYDWEAHYGQIRGQLCKRTSYNTYGGEHQTGGTPFRKNYAGVGYRYDPELDAFIPPKPYASWVLNQQTCLWQAPVSMPNDNRQYKWDETTINWILNIDENIPDTAEELDRVWKGSYDPLTLYQKNDLVYYNKDNFLATYSESTFSNQVPEFSSGITNTAYWQKMTRINV